MKRRKKKKKKGRKKKRKEKNDLHSNRSIRAVSHFPIQSHSLQLFFSFHENTTKARTKTCVN